MKYLRRKQVGFTLIELMVSLTIGATVTSAGLMLYLQISKNRNLIQAESALQNNGYFVRQTLRHLINQAGYRQIDSSSLDSTLLPVKNLEQTFLSSNTLWKAGEYIKTVDNGIKFRFEGASNSAGNPDGSFVNCLGVPIASGDIAEIQLTVDDGALLCSSFGSSVELISPDDNVRAEQLAVSWGVDTNNDMSVDEYRTTTATLSSTENLLSARLAILLSSENEVMTDNLGYTFNGSKYSAPDSRIRKEIVTTIRLKH